MCNEVEEEPQDIGRLVVLVGKGYFAFTSIIQPVRSSKDSAEAVSAQRSMPEILPGSEKVVTRHTESYIVHGDQLEVT